MRPANYGKKYPAEPLTRDEVHRLMGACSRRGNAGLRNRALIAVFYRAGLRCAEALDLRVKDLDLEAGTIAVLHGKGDRRRIVGVDAEASAVVEVWLARRQALGIAAGRPVFCVFTRPNVGGRMHDSVVRETLKALGAKAGLEKRVHPHGLRHTYATELAREGVPVHVIRRLLGHRSLETTQRYIDHLTGVDVVGAIHARGSWTGELSHLDDLAA